MNVGTHILSFPSPSGRVGVPRVLADWGKESNASLVCLPSQPHASSQDNNGRWAGNYSWPLDHAGYLLAAADTLRMARGRASVLLYNAGNEIYPLDKCWAPAPLRTLAEQLDPRSTPFEYSSMGNFSVEWDPSKVGV